VRRNHVARAKWLFVESPSRSKSLMSRDRTAKVVSTFADPALVGPQGSELGDR
jgi:hypothetical protein